MSAKYVLKLYLMGQTPNNQKLIKNLKDILEGELKGVYELEIIDVLKQPQLAADEKILATPTIMKVLPPPLKRVIGDLTDKGKLLLGLDVVAKAEKAEKPKKKLPKIHEEACMRISTALTKLTGKNAIVNIINPQVKNVKYFTPPIASEEIVASIYLPITGQIKGSALLIFPKEDAFNLSDLLFGRKIGTTKEPTELDESALKEIGNIFCGSYLMPLTNALKMKVMEQTAEFSIESFDSIFKRIITKFTEKAEKVLVIEIQFIFTELTLKSYFSLLLEGREIEQALGFLE